MKASHKLDLRGEVCPYTFVKTILALEEMDPGQVLEVTVDHAPAVENVPRSVANRGHKVLNVRQVTDSDWSITVRKGEGEVG
ncbi:MAG: sulfurtransferase TusA family protein [Chloroflexota bacterium]|nr:sulfurtransferase TusA family protein [Chloroflexota bacterium]